MKVYNNQLLHDCIITYKIDGIQVKYTNGIPTSRANKPLYNLPIMPDGIYEYFNTDWNTSVSDVRTKEGKELNTNNLYRLDIIDPRLIITKASNLDKHLVQSYFNTAIQLGYEGLVIHTKNKMFKVKSKETFDVIVTGYQEGKGKNKGIMGALITNMGKIGSGYTEIQRKLFTPDFIIGKCIEVECMSITTNGKFRHPRFLRLREDKI